MATFMRPKSPHLARAYRAARPGFATAIFFSFFINLLVFVGPIYMMQIYDRVITSRNSMTLLLLTIIAAFLLIIYGVLERIRSALLVRVGMVFDDKARTELFNSILKGTIKNPAGGHAQALRDLDMLREFLTGTGLISFCDAPWVPIFIAGCFILHPWFGYTALSGAVVIFALALANELTTRDGLKKAQQSGIAANHYASTTFRNAEVLHSMGMLSPLRERWVTKHEEQLGWQGNASDRAGRFVAATKFFRAFVQVLILGIGAYLAIEKEVSPGAMIAASIIMGRALAPVEMAVANWKGFVAARGAEERIEKLYEMLPPDPERMPLPPPTGALAVESATISPPGGKQVILRNVSFAVQPGEILAVIGPSAAGKSSLARALVGVWMPAGGAVRIDGAELSHWDAQELGKYIGYLPQDVELFSGTVAENVSRFDMSDEGKIIQAARMAGVHDIIQSFPEGYNTQIGDGGYVLSGGQRQRIGLARAIFGMPSIIVLDEPNANLDSDGEAALVRSLQQLREAKRTVVLITHKTNILAIADKVLFLAGGQVQAFGSRDEVLAKVLGPRIAQLPSQGGGQPAPPTAPPAVARG